MKLNVGIKTSALAVALVLAAGALAPDAAFARQAEEKQTPAAKQEKKKSKEGSHPAPAAATAAEQGPGEHLEPDDAASAPRPGMPEEAQANRVEQRSEEEASVLPYYNNFLSQYRLGPEDVISVAVFGHERYSKAGIVVPPDGRISYYLVRGGVHVAGRTTEQVADEITKHLDEYIIDPKVTVSLEKAMSARYGVMGDVAQPGIRPMTRRLTVYEALLEAGGVLSTGNKKKVLLVRRRDDNTLRPQVVDVAAIERGNAPDSIYLAPGDQVFVPGNRLKTVNKVLGLLPVLSFARIFTGGF